MYHCHGDRWEFMGETTYPCCNGQGTLRPWGRRKDTSPVISLFVKGTKMTETSWRDVSGLSITQAQRT